MVQEAALVVLELLPLLPVPQGQQVERRQTAIAAAAAAAAALLLVLVVVRPRGRPACELQRARGEEFHLLLLLLLVEVVVAGRLQGRWPVGQVLQVPKHLYQLLQGGLLRLLLLLAVEQPGQSLEVDACSQ